MQTCLAGLHSNCVDSGIVAGACTDEDQIPIAHGCAAAVPNIACLHRQSSIHINVWFRTDSRRHMGQDRQLACYISELSVAALCQSLRLVNKLLSNLKD